MKTIYGIGAMALLLGAAAGTQAKDREGQTRVVTALNLPRTSYWSITDPIS